MINENLPSQWVTAKYTIKIAAEFRHFILIKYEKLTGINIYFYSIYERCELLLSYRSIQVALCLNNEHNLVFW